MTRLEKIQIINIDLGITENMLEKIKAIGVAKTAISEVFRLEPSFQSELEAIQLTLDSLLEEVYTLHCVDRQEYQRRLREVFENEKHSV